MKIKTKILGKHQGGVSVLFFGTYSDFSVLFEIGSRHHPSLQGLKKVHRVLFDYGLGYPLF